MAYEKERQRMLNLHLKPRGITDLRVLAAMTAVPRERFVRPEDQHLAYQDSALAIGCNQTISQPFIVAYMTQALELRGGERVLEIGTGSGYQAAVLHELGAEVHTIERHAELARRAALIWEAVGYEICCHRVGDGAEGDPEHAPFDRLIITAAVRKCPALLWEQLSEGGIVVGPFGNRFSQRLLAVRKLQGEPHADFLCGCRFVPFVSNKV